MTTTTVTIERGAGALTRVLGRCAKRHGTIRAPHHTASRQSVMGQVRHTPEGWAFDPGELTLAGSGSLVLEDLPEFRPDVLKELGRALREGAITLVLPDPMLDARARFFERYKAGEDGADGSLTLRVPLRPLRVFATAQECPCGHATRCSCTDGQRRRWEQRVQVALALLNGPDYFVPDEPVLVCMADVDPTPTLRSCEACGIETTLSVCPLCDPEGLSEDPSLLAEARDIVASVGRLSPDWAAAGYATAREAARALVGDGRGDAGTLAATILAGGLS